MELTRDQIEMALSRKCLTIMALLFCAQVAFAPPQLIIPRHTGIRLYQILNSACLFNTRYHEHISLAPTPSPAPAT